MKNFGIYCFYNLFFGALLWTGAFHHAGAWGVVWVLQVVSLLLGAMLFFGISLMDEKTKGEWLANHAPKGWRAPGWFGVPLDVCFAMWCAWFGRPVLAFSILLTCGLTHAVRILIRLEREEHAKRSHPAA
jgi:hypothetical protein